MVSMSQVKKGQSCVIREFDCEPRFISRLLSQGLTPGTKIEVKQAGFGRPVLILARETTLALNSRDAKQIKVEVVDR
ncbi:MAG: ferrous iron transport protein A [Deltaproteobacteria bacterium]|jgi:ferrous iron transport protein A|nr:ferrous iron transport protein A [Deltaproteobacteria bacterium]